MSRYECDCGAIYSHPDQLIACANNRHGQPKRKPMGVDVKCDSLARAFLDEINGATEADIVALSEAIQTACEDACNDVEARTGR